jgi:hypothetical protein
LLLTTFEAKDPEPIMMTAIGTLLYCLLSTGGLVDDGKQKKALTTWGQFLHHHYKISPVFLHVHRLRLLARPNGPRLTRSCLSGILLSTKLKQVMG